MASVARIAWDVLAQLSEANTTGTNRTMIDEYAEGARELAAVSLEVITGGQHASGAYIAAPFYPPLCVCLAAGRRVLRLCDGPARAR